jgi:hypothetical protein
MNLHVSNEIVDILSSIKIYFGLVQNVESYGMSNILRLIVESSIKTVL